MSPRAGFPAPAASRLAPAALARRAELRADRHAAALGFAPVLADVLHVMHTGERGNDTATAAFASRGETGYFGAVIPARTGRTGLLGRLLASHPDHCTRLHHLAPHLERPRG